MAMCILLCLLNEKHGIHYMNQENSVAIFVLQFKIQSGVTSTLCTLATVAVKQVDIKLDSKRKKALPVQCAA